MSKRIYVGNLPWSVGKTELEKGFSKFGDIEEATVISNKYTGRSRGFGFVTYKNDADAEKAISEMHEKDFEGRNILVKEARPMKSDINASAGEAKSMEEKKAEKSSEEGGDNGQPEEESEDTGKEPEENTDKEG